ncbi:sodium:neurotransmitter symporter family domain-containing protein [Ditylenchus destructor]|uniref:Sodium:neurotransmitter symporter family domain-containing protein n=1 Tax=Ditylenchus destructor TaxID=166010 RepID=A0AAD4NHA2_9BILA|nr:sodium:neurotransmitter symporter family domain-containing protein [Ditylenchus destructor]
MPSSSSGKNLLQLPNGKKSSDRDSAERPVFECSDVDEAEGDNNGKLNSRVTFSEESVAIENGRMLPEGVIHMATDENREALLQKNGGGAFLIPYLLMMALNGIPLFLIELGIGQRLQTGPVGVWNAIHPYLGGVGVASAIVSYLVSLYYNVILTWVIYYLYNSFRIHLPWSTCPTLENGTAVLECAKSSSPTKYFWNREAIETSNSIGETNGFTMHITVCLVLAWILIYFCVMKGIKSSGKVMYLTATFPYVVTTIFLARSLMLEGATDGLLYMLSPDLSRLWDPEVWLEAATQIFYSMGLGFGGLIAFSSYNPIKNNCKRDCIWLSVANLITSLYTAVLIFSVLGFMGHKNYMNCIDTDMSKILELYPGKFSNLEEIKGNITLDEYVYFTEHNFHMSEFPKMAEHTQHCSYHKIIEQAAEGTGLAFVVFTEAILQFPLPPLWSVLFFMMLLMLGLGSMFGTLEGVITSLNDSKIIRVEKPVITAVLCGTACVIGLIFTTKSGQYWVSLFDHFAGTYALMGVAFFEIIAVVYVYGFRRFCRDLEYMTGEQIGSYWLITWRFISPSIMFFIFFCSVIKSFIKTPKYLAYDSETTHQHKIVYPTWALFIALGLVVLAMAPVPFVYFVRKFKIWSAEGDIPAASKCLGSTPSTTYMLKSQMSFNRMVESTASEMENIGARDESRPKLNGTSTSKNAHSHSTKSNSNHKGTSNHSNKDKSSNENVNSVQQLSPIKEHIPTKEQNTPPNTRNRRKLSLEK